MINYLTSAIYDRRRELFYGVVYFYEDSSNRVYMIRSAIGHPYRDLALLDANDLLTDLINKRERKMSSYSLAYLAARDFNEGMIMPSSQYKLRQQTKSGTIYTFNDGSSMVIPKFGWQMPIVVCVSSSPLYDNSHDATPESFSAKQKLAG